MKWIVTEIDGKVASIAADYRHFAGIAARIAAHSPDAVERVATRKITTDELVELGKTLRWEDLCLYGSKFQKSVWKALFDLTHPADGEDTCHFDQAKRAEKSTLLSYSDLAARVDNPQGVRAVAHAVALNPVAYVIPCHLIVPKESVDKIHEIRRSAESTLFRGSDLYLLDSISVGEYAYGPAVKLELIKKQLAK